MVWIFTLTFVIFIEWLIYDQYTYNTWESNDFGNLCGFLGIVYMILMLMAQTEGLI